MEKSQAQKSSSFNKEKSGVKPESVVTKKPGDDLKKSQQYQQQPMQQQVNKGSDKNKK